MATARASRLYATVWRWHFYAGLFVMPFLLVLALTGALYLFNPQVSHVEERAFRGLPTATRVTPAAQVAAALRAAPGATFGNYRLPEAPGDAAMVTVRLASGARQMFVAPDGEVVGSLDPDRRIMQRVKKIHSQMFLGPRGSWLVELVACWAIVLVASGLYLWWPRERGLAGVLLMRRDGRGKWRWRDLHAVTAFWIVGFVGVLLLTSLPWTSVWGSAFQAVRAELGWVDGPPEWTLGGEPPAGVPADPHAGHHGMPDMPGMAPAPAAGLDRMVGRAAAEALPFPVFVAPPGGMGRFGAPAGDVWTVYSDTQNRPRQVTIRYDAHSLAEIGRKGYGRGIDKAIGYGIAWHEGQLFGPANQAAGLLTVAGLLTLIVTGFVLWRRRRPAGTLGAPPGGAGRARGALAILLVLAALLPLLALSLVVLFLVDWLLLPRVPRLRRWLGAA